MKKFFVFLFLVNVLFGEVIDKIVATVNGLPITSYEVSKLSSQANIPPQKALSLLIDQKLIESEIKKHNINVDDFELENTMEKIARQNGLSLFEFKNILVQKGEFNQFKENLKKDLLKKKLFDQIVQTKLNITPQELKNYYEQNKDDFKVFNTIDVVKYTANDKQILQKIKQNPLANRDIKPEEITYSSKELPLALLFLFKQTNSGEFTPIINDGLGYTMFYVKNKSGVTFIPFEKVKNAIANKLAAEKREMILKDYFSKLKNRAYIKVYN